MVNILKLLLSFVAFSLLAGGCSTYDAVRVVTSRNPGKAIEHTAKHRIKHYQSNPLRLASDVRKLVKLFSGEIDRQWGRKERILPSPHRYVKYTQNYKSRAIIDFDSGLIRIETLATKRPVASLRSAIVTTLLTPDDPRAVDLYSAKTIKLTGRPYLLGLVQDRRGRNIDKPARAERHADYLIASGLQKRQIKTAGQTKTVHQVQFQMVNDHADRRARRYAGLVGHYAKRFNISRSLVYAIIKTESNFNPYAVSQAPAYGLMQLVPHSGGRDAFRHVKGRDRNPSAEYLFDAGNNIELGVGYLDIISSRYLNGIADPISREYCTIAAYNTGAGNVLRIFAKDRKRAKRIINSMPPAAVYQRLRKHLQHAEARRYLLKVTEARRQFTRL